jgi:TolB-like protein/tetratricopeptide (TPR) repeat protein
MMDVRDPSVGAESARAALASILDSKVFARSVQLRRFLEFTVSETLEGRSDEVKEYTIAVEAYRRPPDFDPRADPIVRTEAHRLRKKLAQYYATEGRADPVRITYPKGSYVPRFDEIDTRLDAPPEPAASEETSPRMVHRTAARWLAAGALAFALPAAVWLNRNPSDGPPRIAVVPFEDLSAGSVHRPIALAASRSILAELTRWPGVEVVSRGADLEPLDPAILPVEEFIRRLNAHYLLEGTFHRVGERCRLSAQLIRIKDGTAVWAEEYTFDWDRVFEVQAEIASDVAREIGARVSAPSRPAARSPSPEAYESFARARHSATEFGNTLIPEYLARAEQELARALELQPDYVDALALQAGLEASKLFPPGPGTDQAAGKMEALLEETLALEPNHIPSLTLKAQLHAYRGEAEEALRRTARAIELDPESAAVHRSAGIVYRWFGFHESALEAYRRSIELRTLSALPYRQRVDELDTLGRREEAEAALRALKSLNVPGTQLANIESEHQLRYDDVAGALRTLEDALDRYEGVATTSSLEIMYGLASALSGDLDQGRRALAKHGDRPRYRDSLINLALVLGETDLALSRIEGNLTAGNYRWLVTSRFVRPYLDEPEFRALSEKLYEKWQRNVELAKDLLPVPPPALPPPEELTRTEQTSLR